MWKTRKNRTLEVAPTDEAAVAAFKKSAEDYARKLPEWAAYNLRTKPFYTIEAEVEPAHLLYFHDVAHLLTALDLPCGSRLLDVACGPGWLSEILYRFGYDVTGVDIAESLLQIAAERIEGLRYPPLGRTSESIRFRRLDVEAETLPERFDGIVLYDCLHHFVDTAAVLRHLRAMLAPGGRLVIVEGVMPAPGSQEEKNLLAETATYGTLEAPFDPDGLVEALKKAGFATVQSYLVVDGIFEKNKESLKEIERRFDSPYQVNFVVCQVEKTRILGFRAAKPWRALIDVQECHLSKDGRKLEMVVRIGNGGRRGWVSDGSFAYGNVCLGIRLLDAAGTVREENAGRTPLGCYVGPTETVELELSYPLPPDSGAVTLAFDLVLQGRFWFVERGSPVVTKSLPDRKS
jgi:SAM-dependent methyltransferase